MSDYDREMAVLEHAIEKCNTALGTGFFHPMEEQQVIDFAAKFRASRTTGCTLSPLERSWLGSKAMGFENYSRAASQILINKRIAVTGEIHIVADTVAEEETPTSPPADEPSATTPADEEAVETEEDVAAAAELTNTIFSGLKDALAGMKPAQVKDLGKKALTSMLTQGMSGRREDVVTETSPMDGGETFGRTITEEEREAGRKGFAALFGGDAPATDEPVVESPVVESPTVETPVVEAPVAEITTVETPVVEAPVAVVEAPVAVVETPTLVVTEGAVAPAAAAPATPDVVMSGKKKRKER